MGSEYRPPFTVSTAAINLIAEISGLIERYVIRLEQADGLKLRKANRIKTIYSSLAIEGNTLSEDEVRDVINGKTVIAPVRQLQEVRNAIRAYDLYPKLDAFKEKDLLKAHSVMMEALVPEAGHYRSQGVGVFGEQGLVHMAPPHAMVPQLMGNLFGWLKNSEDHLLIRSCVFHYEFEFIHPFLDGNGRMGRLWQSLILGKLNPVFEFLPVENMVHANQQRYYDAIMQSGALADCGPFIDFMLGEISASLKAHQKKDVGVNVGTNVGTSERKVLEAIARDAAVTARQLSAMLGVTERQCERLLAKLKRAGIIQRIGPNKGGSWRLTDTNS